MAEICQSVEIETSCDVSIAIQNDSTSMEQIRTMPEQKILEVPRQLLEGMAEVSQLAETETSCDVSVAMRKACTSIEQKLTLPWKLPGRTIPRVPREILEVNKKAYEPCIISIGPYYHGQARLKEMEGQKVQYLKELLRWTKQSVETYLSAIKNVVKDARNCYSDHLLSLEDFLEMMVLDGCFIIQFFMRPSKDSFYYRGLINTILNDLVLVENQLPFFVLCELLKVIFHNSEGSPDPINRFIHWILEVFEEYMPGLRVDTTYDGNSIKNVKHIGHLLYSNWLPSKKAIEEYEMGPKERSMKLVRSATRLREAGIKFKMVQTREYEETSLFDIKFEKGILKMPVVTIDDHTESLFRNLIVCEQFDNTDLSFLTEYIVLMDSLINSGKDVELLCKCGIIVNMLGDEESVATLFNSLGARISLSSPCTFYAKLFMDVNNHVVSSWNVWNANLMDKYFNTPWALISFLAASLLLLLTMLQTTFTIFPRS